VTPRDDGHARSAAIAQYTATYEWFAESAQIYANSNLANTVAHTAMLFLDAADAEERDPEPSVARSCVCHECLFYRMFGPKDVPAIECEPV
jgi:hypothetical protein